MRLKSDLGERVEFKILGYQFPDLLNEVYDSNWLMIQVAVDHQRGYWKASDPALLTAEVEKLIEWFTAIHGDMPIRDSCSFIEPNLYFELELRPEWAKPEHPDMRDLWVEISLTPKALDDIIESLTSQLARFPTRA